MVRKEYQKREIIFSENDYQKWMYSICEGTVDIFSGYGTTDEKKLATLTEGQFFGEIGMIAMMPRTATAVAAADHVVLEQIADDFEEYLAKHPEYLQPIMSNVSRRIRELTEELSMVTQISNEAMRKKECGDYLTGWLAVSLNKLINKLTPRKLISDEFIVMRKRQQALCGESPSVIRFYEGNVIFRAGEDADCMYEICDGCVGIYSDYGTENQKLLTKLSVEDTFGEMGVLDEMPRSATAVCLTDCVVLVVKPEAFLHYFGKKPFKVMRILQHMCIRLRNLTKIYLEVCRTLEEMPDLRAKDFQEDAAMVKLEQIRQSQLYIGMYNDYCCADWMYERY